MTKEILSSKKISKTLCAKKDAKDILRNEYGLAINKKRLLLSIVIDSKHADEAVEFLKGLLEAVQAISVNVVILAPSSLKKALNQFKSPRGVFLLESEECNEETVLEASDVSFAFPLSTMTDKSLKKMWAFGVVPIASSKSPQIQDYDPNREIGNGFAIRHDGIWDVFAALVRASESFRFPYDWKHIVRQTLNS